MQADLKRHATGKDFAGSFHFNRRFYICKPYLYFSAGSAGWLMTLIKGKSEGSY
jgi:hypothetical protein